MASIQPQPVRIRAKSSHVAKWGAACAPCAAAKAKCFKRPGVSGSKCERCERLLKECIAQVHRPRKKRQAKLRAANTEGRLDGLLEVLGVSGSGPFPPDGAIQDTTCIPSEGEPFVTDQDRPFPVIRAPCLTHCAPENGFVPIPETYLSHVPPNCIAQPESSMCPPPPDSDETLLAIYRNELAPVYPFVIIPGEVTANALKATRPFLMSAIRMVASFRSLKSMRGQMFQLMNYISDHMLIRAERSLDLLMGIVVILGWYHHHCVRHSQMNNLISLAKSLIGDLGLNRNPFSLDSLRVLLPHPGQRKERTNEERRLLLAIWYLNSSASIYYFKLDSMRYSMYMQKCLTELEEAKEYESDELLAQYIRIQHLTERVAQLRPPDEGSKDVVDTPRAPMSAYVKVFQDELDKIRTNMPDSLKNHNLITTHLRTAQVHLHEPPVIDATLLATMSDPGFSLAFGASSTLDLFYLSTDAVKNWFESWLLNSPLEYYRYPTPIISQLIYVGVMLARWAKYAVPRSLYPVRLPVPPGTNTGGTSSREEIDPQLQEAVVTLKEKMSTLGLGLNMVEFLVALGKKSGQASAFTIANAAEPGACDNNFWDFGEKKALLVRVMLARWADMVDRGQLRSAGEHANDQGDIGRSDDDGARRGEGEGENTQQSENIDMAMLNPGFAQVPLATTQQDQWAWDTLWSSHVFEGVDTSLWFDDVGEWGNTITNTMGHMHIQ